MPNKHFTLQEIADYLSAKLVGDSACVIKEIAPLNLAKKGQISFLENPHYCKYLETTEASAIVLSEDSAKLAKDKNLLITSDPYLAYAKISALFDNAPGVVPGIHPTAVIGNNCTIDPTAFIGPNCSIWDNVKIGANSRLYSNVSVYHNVTIGERAIIHSGVVIGSDGFGMANDKGVWRKIHQLGGVVIGNDVEIGANTTIDRGALENTIIGDGVKLDNQIQIAHNVQIGANTAIAGCVGIAGSAKIGKHCMIGGGAGINGHIEICDGVIITARAGVYESITTPGVYASAIPAMPHKTWWRILHRLFKIDDLFRRVKKLENK